MFASFSFYTYAASIYVLILAQTRVSQASMINRDECLTLAGVCTLCKRIEVCDEMTLCSTWIQVYLNTLLYIH